MPLRTPVREGEQSPDSAYFLSLLDAANYYTNNHISVLPISSTEDGGKIPLLEHGFKDASDDPLRARMWFSDVNFQKRGLMLGIATGTPSGLCVIDCDVKNGQQGPDIFAEICRSRGASPSACFVETPSGGVHYYYRLAQGQTVPSATGKWPGVDVRCEGGCIVAPPSRTRQGRLYKRCSGSLVIPQAPFLPDWLYKMLIPTSSASLPSSSSSSGQSVAVEYQGQENEIIEQSLSFLRRAQPGQRNNRLFACASSLFRLFSEEGSAGRNALIAALYETSIGLGLTEREVLNTLDSAKRKAVELGTFSTSSPMPGWLKQIASSPMENFVSDEEEEQEISPGKLLVLPPPPLNFWPQELQMLVNDISGAKNVSREMVMIMLLALGSACTGFSRVLELKQGWREPALLWLVLVAGSGTGKSHTCNLVFQHLKRREAEIKTRYRRERAKYERERDEWKRGGRDMMTEPPKEPENIQYTVEDTTLEALAELFRWNGKRGLALIKDEAWKIFENIDKYTAKGSSKDRLLNMWDAEPWQSSRKTQDGQSRELYLPRAPLSFFGMLQTSVLPEFFSKTDIKLGFAQRCLLVCAQIDRPPVFSAPPVKPETIATLEDITDRMLAFEMGEKDSATDLPMPITVNMDNEATALYEDFFDQTARHMVQVDDEESSWIAKTQRNTARVALVLYCLTQAIRGRQAMEEKLDGNIMEAAIRTVRWMDRHRQTLSPFTQLEFRQSPRPVDKLLARKIMEHSDDIRKAGYSVLVKTLLEWCADSSVECSARTIGHAATRLGIPCVHTREGNARKFSEKTLEVCARFCNVMGDRLAEVNCEKEADNR